MQVGDLVKWTAPHPHPEDCLIGLVELVDDRYIYVRWADGELDEYLIKSVHLFDLEVIS